MIIISIIIFCLNYANGDGHNCYGVKLLYLQLVS